MKIGKWLLSLIMKVWHSTNKVTFSSNHYNYSAESRIQHTNIYLLSSGHAESNQHVPRGQEHGKTLYIFTYSAKPKEQQSESPSFKMNLKFK